MGACCSSPPPVKEGVWEAPEGYPPPPQLLWHPSARTLPTIDEPEGSEVSREDRSSFDSPPDSPDSYRYSVDPQDSGYDPDSEPPPLFPNSPKPEFEYPEPPASLITEGEESLPERDSSSESLELTWVPVEVPRVVIEIAA